MVAHEALIAAVVRTTRCDVYLELGVSFCGTFNVVAPLVRRAIAVDCRDCSRSMVKGEFFLGSTESFFHSDLARDLSVDAAFIDADHSFECVQRDLLYTLGLLSSKGVVMLHDTDPARLDWLSPERCGDAFRVINYIERDLPSLDVVTLPVGDSGLSLVRRKRNRRVLSLVS